MSATDLATALWGLGVFSLLGLVFGLALALVARRFHVPVDPRIEAVRERLPAANCGACGFAGCQAYAEAVVTRPEVSASLCVPGREAVARAIAAMTGKEMGTVADRIVVMRCHGTSAYARQEADRLACVAWNERMTRLGGPPDPAPSLRAAISGGFAFLRVACNGCHQQAWIDLRKLRRAPETPIDALARALICSLCRRGRSFSRAKLQMLCQFSGEVGPDPYQERE